MGQDKIYSCTDDSEICVSYVKCSVADHYPDLADEDLVAGRIFLKISQ